MSLQPFADGLRGHGLIGLAREVREQELPQGGAAFLISGEFAAIIDHAGDVGGLERLPARPHCGECEQRVSERSGLLVVFFLREEDGLEVEFDAGETSGMFDG